jgi:hypothetical protein
MTTTVDAALEQIANNPNATACERAYLAEMTARLELTQMRGIVAAGERHGGGNAVAQARDPQSLFHGAIAAERAAGRTGGPAAQVLRECLAEDLGYELAHGVPPVAGTAQSLLLGLLLGVDVPE